MQGRAATARLGRSPRTFKPSAHPPRRGGAWRGGLPPAKHRLQVSVFASRCAVATPPPRCATNRRRTETRARDAVQRAIGATAGLSAAPRRTGCARDRRVSPRRAMCAGGAGGACPQSSQCCGGLRCANGKCPRPRIFGPVCNHRQAQMRVEESVINGRTVTPSVRQLAKRLSHPLDAHARLSAFRRARRGR
jgi:hypothetical protein